MSAPSPLARNHFQVQWGGSRTGFAEVSGLAIEMKTADYRDGTSNLDINLTMPGIISHPHLVLKRTLVAGDNDFYSWMNTIQFNSVTRREVVVLLLDSNGAPLVTWNFVNAYPVKLEYSPLESQNAGAMYETLYLAYDSMTVQN